MRVSNAPRTPMIFSYSLSATLVRRLAQVRGRRGRVRPEHGLPREHVHELGFDAHLAVGLREDAAHDDVVGAQLLPGGGIHLVRAGGRAHHVGARHGLEAAAALRSRSMTCATSRPPSAGTARENGTMAIGMGSVTPEVMVRRSCAKAGAASDERRQDETGREFFHAWVHEVGANVSSKLRSNERRIRRRGRGDARRPRLRPIRATRHRRRCN